MELTIENVLYLLAEPKDENKPWMTARYLSKRIGLKENGSAAVERCLLDYYQQNSTNSALPEVRYSSLPSKETLEVLWAHTKFVGQRELTQLHKTDVAEEIPGIDTDATSPDVFLSHSFKDYEDVIEIARQLQKQNVTPWLAETHIQQGQHINEEVTSALLQTKCFALYLSDNTLASKWTGKEYGDARRRGMKIFVIADCRHSVVRSLMENRPNYRMQFKNELARDAAHFFQDLFTDEANITLFFPYPDDALNIDQLKYATNVYPIFQLSDLIKQAISVHENRY